MDQLFWDLFLRIQQMSWGLAGTDKVVWRGCISPRTELSPPGGYKILSVSRLRDWYRSFVPGLNRLCRCRNVGSRRMSVKSSCWPMGMR